MYLKPHTTKIAYEIGRARSQTLSHCQILGSRCYILNDREYLGKFQSKSDEGFFLDTQTTMELGMTKGPAPRACVGLIRASGLGLSLSNQSTDWRALVRLGHGLEILGPAWPTKKDRIVWAGPDSSQPRPDFFKKSKFKF